MTGGGLLVAGTTSDAGKSVVTAGICRWLVRQGVRAFHVGPQVRPGGSAKAYVDAEYVRSWRSLVDDAMERL